MKELIGAAERARSCVGRYGGSAKAADTEAVVIPANKEQPRQAFVRFCTAGCIVEYKWYWAAADKKKEKRIILVEIKIKVMIWSAKSQLPSE